MERSAGTGLRGCGAACCKSSVDQRGKKTNAMFIKGKNKTKTTKSGLECRRPCKNKPCFRCLEEHSSAGVRAVMEGGQP